MNEKWGVLVAVGGFIGVTFLCDMLYEFAWYRHALMITNRWGNSVKAWGKQSFEDYMTWSLSLPEPWNIVAVFMPSLLLLVATVFLIKHRKGD